MNNTKQQIILEIDQPMEGTFSIKVEGYTSIKHDIEVINGTFEKATQTEKWNSGEAIFTLNPNELMKLMNEWEDGKLNIIHEAINNHVYYNYRTHLTLDQAKDFFGKYGYTFTHDLSDIEKIEEALETNTPEQFAINCKKGMSESDLARFIEALQK